MSTDRSGHLPFVFLLQRSPRTEAKASVRGPQIKHLLDLVRRAALFPSQPACRYGDESIQDERVSANESIRLLTLRSRRASRRIALAYIEMHGFLRTQERKASDTLT
jgi:hypothetical protein